MKIVIVRVKGDNSDSEVKKKGNNDSEKVEGDADIYLVNTHININSYLTFFSCLK